MARLSINDLNNLSGNSKERIDKLYGYFRSAHTSLYNKLCKWESKYTNAVNTIDKNNDYLLYKKFQELYYECSELLDVVDLFDSYTNEYTSLLYSLQIPINETQALVSILNKKKKEVIEKQSSCYGIYSEASDRIFEWED